MSETKKWRIAAIPGDGIGTEVMDATLCVLNSLFENAEIDFKWDLLDWPSTDWYSQHGEMMPANGLEILRSYDALLLGALGDPGPADNLDRFMLPDGISLEPLLRIRKGFDLWACERPARLAEGVPQYLADPRAKDVDMLVIRENSEGEYVNQGGRLHIGKPQEVATQIEVFTRHATERLIRHAFSRACERLNERKASGAPLPEYLDDRGGVAGAQVCLITKRNALPHWGELYCDIFAEIAEDNTDIAIHHELVDAACMKFVQAPWQFDVVVASNLQGDILTDLAAILSGGLGVASSSNINPMDRNNPPLFEPTHGSAPDIAGKNIADPRAMMLTAANMMDWLGEEDDHLTIIASKFRSAVERDLAQKYSEPRSTTQIRDAVIAQLDSK